MAFAYRGDPQLIKSGDWLNGYALIPGPFRELTVFFSDGLGWEHVSVSTRGRCPNWEEMCFIKRLFWAADDVVMQLHPAERDYINQHPHCLHLWRPNGGRTIPEPPPQLVGVVPMKLEQP